MNVCVIKKIFVDARAFFILEILYTCYLDHSKYKIITKVFLIYSLLSKNKL